MLSEINFLWSISFETLIVEYLQTSHNYLMEIPPFYISVDIKIADQNTCNIFLWFTCSIPDASNKYTCLQPRLWVRLS